MRILLIMGGWSSERDVSLSSSKVVHSTLLELGHTVTCLDPLTDLNSLLDEARKHDFAFIALHGSPGEDGLIQSMLDLAGCPYQGASSASSLLALNKSASKIFFKDYNLPTAEWVLLSKKPSSDWLPPFNFPIFIKSNTGGSSLHMEKVSTKAELPKALDTLFANATEYIVEPAITGFEVTCGVLGELVLGKEEPKALPPILIRSKSASGVFDYASKYLPDQAEEICPAPIGEELTAKVQDIAIKAHKALGLRGYSRADFIVTNENEPMILEVNTLPGLTLNSLLPKEVKAIGMTFKELIARLIDLGLAANKKA